MTDKQTPVRFPEPLKKRLKRVSYLMDISINSLVLQAVEKYLPEMEKQCKGKEE